MAKCRAENRQTAMVNCARSGVLSIRPGLELASSEKEALIREGLVEEIVSDRRPHKRPFPLYRLTPAGRAVISEGQ